MHPLLQITFRGMSPSEPFALCVRGELHRLEPLRGRISACHVTLERAPEARRDPDLYRLRLDARTPEGAIVLDRRSGTISSEDELCQIAQGAFEALAVRLQDLPRAARLS